VEPSMGRSSRIDDIDKEMSLERYINIVAKGRKNMDVLMDLYRSIERKEIMILDPNPPRRFTEYLRRLDYTLWLYMVLVMIITTIATIIFDNPWTRPLRWLLGTIFTLFLPGYVTTEALYPDENSLNNIERIAISIGLSLAITPLIGLLLNYTPWGIKLESILLSQTMYILIILIVAGYRKFKIIRIIYEASKKRKRK
jgi:uncharacterized membrane protein